MFDKATTKQVMLEHKWMIESADTSRFKFAENRSERKRVREKVSRSKERVPRACRD